MTVQPGTSLGPYEIVSSVGAGGMGEVWRARDTRLDRDVAVKILPHGFAQDERLRQRFEREAKTISSLNHPHICTLFDVGHEGDSHYLVMEMIEGDTLAERLKKGPLPLHEVLRYGRQIASALDAAHRQGITHRDLKPGNVMLTKSGAKLLDFGLAKTASEGGAPLDGLTSLPTEEQPLTEQGTILGTFQYMAPEQLEGLEADARTDIFALGALLYEMATGHRAFAGGTKTSLIAAIVSSQPEPISTVVAMTPPALDHVVRRCLEKDPDDRWQSAHDVASELQWISEAGSQAGTPAPVARGLRARALLWPAMALLAALVAYYVGSTKTHQPPTSAVSASLISSYEMSADHMALSPDSRTLVFVGSPVGNVQRSLWLRALDTRAERRIEGTEGASYPFWSPDSRQVGFFADGKLKRVEVATGAVLTIGEAEDGRGASWGEGGDDSAGTIVFAPGRFSGLLEISPAGGTLRPVTEVEAEGQSHRWPRLLPGGWLLYSDKGRPDGDEGLWILHRSSGEARLLIPRSAEAIFVAGRLLFEQDGDLVARRFEIETGQIFGTPELVVDGIDVSPFQWTVGATATDEVLVYRHAPTDASRLIWYDEHGEEIGQLGEPADYGPFTISPVGDRAMVTMSFDDLDSQLYLVDLTSGSRRRLSSRDVSLFGIWAPDGEQVAYLSLVDGRKEIVVQPVDEPDATRVLYSGDVYVIPSDWSPDGRYIVYSQQTNSGDQDLWARLSDGSAEPFQVIASPANEWSGEISTDGNWILYASDASGQAEIYLSRFPSGDGTRQVSSGGALWNTMTWWTPGGDELLYLDQDARFVRYSADFENGRIALGEPSLLFEGRTLPEVFGNSTVGRQHPTDGRYLLLQPDLSHQTQLEVVSNWAAPSQDEAR